ncbi:MAG: serine/threonine-protein kinase [Acidobacteriota bacterium]
MSAETERWLPLALSVSDGAVVDWESVHRNAQSDDERALVQQLQALASLSNVAESLQTGASRDDIAAAPASDGSWGPFELRERLSAGSFGEVYRARDPRLDTDVALKLLTPSATAEALGQRAIEEGRLLAKVRHAHVVSVYGADIHEGRVGIWMELIEGRTLSDVLATQGALGAREAIAIGSDLCAALAAVHAAGLIHRDVKAQNVMREHGGRVVLMDLGASLDVSRSHEVASAAAISGTPLYMAPELFKREAATARSDLYALGVLLFHLVTQQFPVAGQSVADVIAKHASGTRRRLRDLRPDLPASFIAAIERAIDPDPNRRFASAGEFDAALRDDVRVDASTPERGVRLGVSFGFLKFSLAIAFAVTFVLLLGSFDRRTNTFRVPSGLDPASAIGHPAGSPLPSTLPGAGDGEVAHAALFKAQLLRDKAGRITLRYTCTTPIWAYVLAETGIGTWRVAFSGTAPLPAAVAGEVLLPPLPDAPRWRVVGSRECWNQDVASLDADTVAVTGIRIVDTTIEEQTKDGR